MNTVTAEIVRTRLINEFLACRLIENSLRGYFCEAMVAEALGPGCKIVSGGWHPWDLQFGDDGAEFPERIRIQVKNSARLQTWNEATGRRTDCKFDLGYRKRPRYFARDCPGTPCEETGFLCELFILCWHPEDDPEIADHTSPEQWRFFSVPVVGSNRGVTEAEVHWAAEKLAKQGKPSYCQRRPETLEQGIRGRPPCPSLTIAELAALDIRAALNPAI